MPHFKKLFWINIFSFGVFLTASLLSSFFESSKSIRLITSLATLLVIFPLFGINAAVILEKVFHQKFDALEKLNVSIAASFLFAPFIFALEYEKLGILLRELPLINSCIVSILAIWTHPPSFFENTKFLIRNFLKNNLSISSGIALLIYAGIGISMVFAFIALPDSDPYYWFLSVQSELNAGTLPAFNLHRPLFYTLVSMFHITAAVDLYAFFKYILPFFALLSLFPATLVANVFSNRIQQITVFLLPLASAAFIMYSYMPIPQAVINICVVFFVFFLVYAFLKKSDFFYFFSGALIFIAYFYHEAAALVFLPWCAVTLFKYAKSIKETIFANKIISLLCAIILLLNTSYLYPLYDFLKNWSGRVFHQSQSLHLNLSFPKSYINIDGNTVGWSNWIGIMKYYAFYVGPLVCAIAIFLLFCFFAPNRTKKLLSELGKRKETLVLGVSFALFFSIAEIFPRIFSIALLPERSWGYAGIFLVAFVPILFKYLPSRKNFWFASLFIGAISVNTLAAIHVNSLKKYLVTPEQIASIEWAKTHLPQKKLVLTNGNGSILRAHIQSEIIDVDNRKFYSDIAVFDSVLAPMISNKSTLEKSYQEYLSTINHNLRFLEESDIYQDTPKILESFQKLSTQSIRMESEFLKYDHNQKSSVTDHLYIYYAKTDTRNPYASRPYFEEKGASTANGKTVFDSYPNRFQRVYAAPDKSVIIWKLISAQIDMVVL